MAGLAAQPGRGQPEAVPAWCEALLLPSRDGSPRASPGELAGKACH